jgi:di/tricarboxylate transporter
MPWPDLSWQNSAITPAQFTLSVVGLIFGLLIFSQVTPDVILIGAVVLLLLTGVLPPGEALAGMSNEGMLTVGVLFVVGAAVRETGGVDFIASLLLGRPKSPTRAVARMTFPTMGLSAFMSNTKTKVKMSISCRRQYACVRRCSGLIRSIYCGRWKIYWKIR